MLIVFLLAMALFQDHVSCTIQAKLWKTTADEVIDLQRADLCIGVSATTDDKMVVLYSPHAWVAIPIQPAPGWRTFQYHWGSTLAHLGPDTIEVQEWGKVIKG